MIESIRQKIAKSHWLPPAIILIVLAGLIWMNNRSTVDRDVFEQAVLDQHKAMHTEQTVMVKQLEGVIDQKTDDRFRGKDAVEMEGRLREYFRVELAKHKDETRSAILKEVHSMIRHHNEAISTLQP